MLTFKKFMKKSLPAIISFLLIFTLFAPQASHAADHSANASLNGMIDKTVDFYKKQNQPLESWWEIVALWGAGQDLEDGSWKLPSWKTLEPTGDEALEPNASGTEHIRYIYSLLAMGEDPAHAWQTDRNLYAELAAQQNLNTGAFAGTLNKHMWAMHALDTGAKLGSDVGTWDTAAKKKAVDYLLSKQLPDGGFAFFGSTSEPDMTGMGMLALGNYQSDSAVQQAIAKIKAYLKTKQLNQENVMYGDNSNSMSAVVSGLTAIGEDVLSDTWAANGKTVLDTYSLFQLADGSLKWIESNTSGNLMATEQGLIALTDIKYQKTVWQRFGDEIKQPVPVYVTAKLQVDGLTGSVYGEQAVMVKSAGKPATALDALQQGLDQANPKISYKIVDSSFGPYVSAIDGRAAGSLGGWDGWMYEVNGIAPLVGAGAYELKENDKVRFYYSTYPALSTESKIANGALNPTINVKLVGDEYTSQAGFSSNWTIDTGNTELKVNSFVRDGSQIIISFTGTAEGGAITIKALGAALVGGYDSESFNVAVPRVVSETTDQAIAINKNETEVVIGAAGEGQVTNNVTLNFETTALPKVTATRGNTVLEIPASTVVTTTTWDKAIELPKKLNTAESGLSNKLDSALSAGNKKVESIAVRIKTGGAEKIQFNQHVAIIIKGQGDKEAGFIDQAGLFTPINKYSDSSVRTDEVYAYNQNGDLVIQTKHFTEFLAFKTTSTSLPGGTGPAPVADKVTLSVEKRSINEGDFVAPAAMTIQAGDTAFTVLKRTLDDKGMALEFSGSGASIYVKAIGGLKELDDAHGSGSGWMYSVNGTFPKVSAGIYTLKNGDVVRWQYTKDLGKDIGAPIDSDQTGGQKPGEKPDEKPEPSTAPKYTDEAKISSWALDAVTKATALGFMQGTSTANPTFEPKRQLTRAEFAALMVKYSGAEPLLADSGFKDVSSQNWYYGYVAAAKEKGLMSGVTDTAFAPNEPITRQEMAAVIVRLKGLTDSSAPQAAIKDRSAVSAWAVPYVNVAYQNGLMTGDNGLFHPQALVTREMAAVTIIRLHELKS